MKKNEGDKIVVEVTEKASHLPPFVTKMTFDDCKTCALAAGKILIGPVIRDGMVFEGLVNHGPLVGTTGGFLKFSDSLIAPDWFAAVVHGGAVVTVVCGILFGLGLGLAASPWWFLLLFFSLGRVFVMINVESLQADSGGKISGFVRLMLMPILTAMEYVAYLFITFFAKKKSIDVHQWIFEEFCSQTYPANPIYLHLPVIPEMEELCARWRKKGYAIYYELGRNQYRWSIERFVSSEPFGVFPDPSLYAVKGKTAYLLS